MDQVAQGSDTNLLLQYILVHCFKSQHVTNFGFLIPNGWSFAT